MKMLDIIDKTRRKIPLTPEEIRFLVNDFTSGKIPDYQLSAWLMAVCIQGLTIEETSALTLAMAKSGKNLTWDDLSWPPIDKHSTGGVGDTTTLLLLPLLSACNVTAAKMSGRGLGFTGGTLDKLDAIPGFQSLLTESDFKSQLAKHQIALTGQSADLAPADGKIYALRDASGTVASLPLIASSIMSKKLAAGASAIVLDVKVGSGSFMKTQEEAQSLAELMIQIGKAAEKKVIAYLTSMAQPLGNYVGNGLEVEECILLLKDNDLSSDLAQVTLTLAGEMIYQAGQSTSPEAGIEKAKSAWLSGKALEKLRLWISIQQGDPTIIESPEKLPQPTHKLKIPAPARGFISHFDTEKLGLLARDLGAGRFQKTDSLDPAAGFILLKRLGEPLQQGEPWLILHRSREISNSFIDQANQAITLSTEKPETPPLFLGRLD